MTQRNLDPGFISRHAAGSIATQAVLALALVAMPWGVGAAGASPAVSQGPTPAKSQLGAEPLSKWQWFHEVPLPKPGNLPWVDFVLTVPVFGESREDLGDLRLYDGQGQERPYALRVREARDERRQLPVRQFNRQSNADHSIEVTLDLGERPAEHNEMDVVTKGTDFRRGAVLEGSDNDRDWGKLVDRAWLVHYQVEGQMIDIHHLPYPPCRLRHLRVRVFSDRSHADDHPEFSSLAVYHTVREPGEYVTREAQFSPREAVSATGGPGSAWIIDLGGLGRCLARRCRSRLPMLSSFAPLPWRCSMVRGRGRSWPAGSCGGRLPIPASRWWFLFSGR